MSAIPAAAYCPVCGERRAAGTRFAAQYCGRGACRQAAHRAKGRLIEKFKSRPRKKPIEPPAETLAAMAMRAAWKSGEWFSSEWANTAARRCGIHLDAPALSLLLDELAEDLLDETVTGTGARSFTFPGRSSLAPKNGARDVATPTAAHLLDAAMLATFWRYATDRHRLVESPTGAAPRHKAPVDQRWLAVQAAGGKGTVERTVIDRSDVSLLDLATLRKRALRDFERAFARVVGLRSEDDAARAASDLAVRAVRDPEFLSRVAAAQETRDVRLAHHRRELAERAGDIDVTSAPPA